MFGLSDFEESSTDRLCCVKWWLIWRVRREGIYMKLYWRVPVTVTGMIQLVLFHPLLECLTPCLAFPLPPPPPPPPEKAIQKALTWFSTVVTAVSPPAEKNPPKSRVVPNQTTAGDLVNTRYTVNSTENLRCCGLWSPCSCPFRNLQSCRLCEGQAISCSVKKSTDSVKSSSCISSFTTCNWVVIFVFSLS